MIKHGGLKYVRGCEILEIVGETNDESTPKIEGEITLNRKGAMRTFRVLLDPNAYQQDMKAHEEKKLEDVYSTFNVVLRRKPAENNFKAVLETIRDLMQGELVVPEWLRSVFLGYGDPAGAWFKGGASAGVVRTVDFRDTFLNWNHLQESWSNMKLIKEHDDNDHHHHQNEILNPPYILTFPPSMYKSLNSSNGHTASVVTEGIRQKLGSLEKEIEPKDQEENTTIVRSYKMPYRGPYPESVTKKNSVKFTPAQGMTNFYCITKVYLIKYFLFFTSNYFLLE